MISGQPMISNTFLFYRNVLKMAFFLTLLLIMALPVQGKLSMEERIGVLPFKVHMREPADHLVTGLQNTLISRLKGLGVQAVDPAAIEKAGLARAVETNLSTARKIAGDMKLDWIFKGSLTQIGKKISLDFTLIPVSTEKKSFSTFVMGEGMDELVRTAERTAVIVKNRLTGIVQIGLIDIRGNQIVETDAIMKVIQSSRGDIFDPSLLDKDLRSIYRMGFFDDVQVDVEEGPGGKKVTFKVSEKPWISRIEFQGNKKADDDELMELAGIDLYSVLNEGKVKESIERLKDYYHKEGYYNVKITDRIEELPANKVALVCMIREGEKVYIDEIRFEGNAKFDDDDLRDLMETSEKGIFSFITDSGFLDRKKLESDLVKVASFYHNHGYIKAKVGEPDISYKRGKGIIIEIKVNEGPQYGVRKVDIKGDLIKNKDELYEELKIKEEEVYNREVIRSDIMRLSEIYSDEGYAFVEVAPEIKEDDKECKVDITYHISKNNKVRFERIAITGNYKTRDKVIRRELKVYEGGYFSGKELKKSSRRLHRLGFFEEVNFDTTRGGTSDQMVLEIDVKERQTGRFSIGAGYSSVENAIGMVEVSQDNLFGRGQSLSAKASLSSRSQRYILDFTEPWLFDKPLSMNVEIYDWEYEYDEYTKHSKGGRLGFSYPLGPEYTRGSVSYSYEDAKVSDIRKGASRLIRDMEGRNVTSSLTLGIERDSRERRFNAREGSVNSLYVEYAGGFLGGDNYFTKYRGKSAWFFPLLKESSISVQGRWGYVQKRTGGELPVYEKFTLGGINTVRGFDYGHISPVDPDTGDRIGGEKMMVYNTEFKFPLLKEQGLVGVLFYDAGNVFADDESYTFSGIRRGAGAGIRWYSPIGPLRLEWGKNLDPKPGEPSSNWEFSIGTPF